MQLSGVVLQNRCSYKFPKILKVKSKSEFFNKVKGCKPIISLKGESDVVVFVKYLYKFYELLRTPLLV